MQVNRFAVGMLALLAVCCGARAERGDDLIEKLRARLGAEAPARAVLGVRVRSLEQLTTAAPILVIAPDEASYAQQIGAWSVRTKYPVLIDDGSREAMENIARFVRAYRPEQIVLAGSSDGEDAGVRGMVEQAVAGAWGAESYGAIGAVWEGAGFAPPGAVVVSERDPAWTGGLALAAARGQVLVWSDSGRGLVGLVIKEDELRALDSTVQRGLEASGYSWRGLGDVIDSVTLCLNRPGRVPIDGEKGQLALTDVIGRHADGRRYAWCGMVHGDAQWSAYRAMCALFLSPTDAWLFDGYPDGFAEPFELEGMRDVLEGAGFDVVLDGAGAGTLARWRDRGDGGVGAGFVQVNTKGHSTWFDLIGGRAYGNDVPILERPGVVHFIHSFSAQNVNPNQSIGSRWLMMGAQAYAGSVHEPYLGAFVPGAALAARLVQEGSPWGAAVRVDDGPAWKIQVFGDPLMVIPSAVQRAEAGETTTGGGRLLSDEMKERVQAGDFGGAVRALVMEGRDNDALRLVKALANDDEGAVIGELAESALYAAAREGDGELYVWLYDRAGAQAKNDPIVRDVLWQVGRRMLDGERGAAVAALLRGNIRAESAADDGAALEGAVSRAGGMDAVRGMYEQILGMELSRQVRQQVEARAGRLR